MSALSSMVQKSARAHQPGRGEAYLYCNQAGWECQFDRQRRNSPISGYDRADPRTHRALRLRVSSRVQAGLLPLMATSSRAASRIWLQPLCIVGGACLALFVLTFVVDAGGSADPSHVWRLIVHPNPSAAFNTLTNAGDIVAAVLAIALTVVAIVVELASNRYTHRVTELFVSEPINFAVMALFVVTTVQGAWVTLTFDWTPERGGFVPNTGVIAAMALLTLCLLILLPYFNFVFAYLNPISILDRISAHTLRAIARAQGDMRTLQREAVRGVEQIGDVALNAMQHRDTGVSMAAVDVLRNLMRDYQPVRGGMPSAWFAIDGELAHDPDFVSMDPHVLRDLSTRRIWFEMKILRQYQMVFGEALSRIRDVAYLIAINTRLSAETAAREGQVELLDLLIKFFNTYLRAAINGSDVRTAYSVIHQYRLLAQALLDHEGGALSLQIAQHLQYYAQVSYAARLPFLVETVAYDLCTLNEVAHERGARIVDELLQVFLHVDREGTGEAHEAILRGVRKAQVKLATYYLQSGDEARARSVFEDMAREDPGRLASIRSELLGVQSSEYWEVTDRGVHFDYLPPERKARIEQFFAWFSR
jgi:hypothetical protein